MWIDDIDINLLITPYGKLKAINGLSLGVMLNKDLNQVIHTALKNLMTDNLFENLIACDVNQIHVCLMPLLCNEYRVPECWSVHIPTDVSYAEIKNTVYLYYKESLSEQPYRLKFKDVSVLNNKLCITVESADLETSHTLQALKDFTLKNLGFRTHAFKAFESRIHLGLWNSESLNDLRYEIEELMIKLTKELEKSLGILKLDGAKLLQHNTLFDMEELVPSSPSSELS